MLLPSALPCEAAKSTLNHPPIRPTLRSLGPYQPLQPAEVLPHTPIQSSCRALQAILGGSLVAPPRMPNPQDRARTTRGPLQPRQHNARVSKSSQLKPQPPRGRNKRRRDEYEQENSDGMEMEEDCLEEEDVKRCQTTPKRRRRIPLAMPLGLTSEDFLSIDSPKGEEPLDMPRTVHGDVDDESGWTTDDDCILVQLVLEKLKLSNHQWNECARVLGRDKDSLGKRWRLLVGEGNVGLRRGKRISRPDLDIMSW